MSQGRAFMSVTGEADHGRGCLDCNYFPSGHVGGIADRAKHAEREARTILAVSEPKSAYSRYDHSSHGLATDALAESLAAFVGDATL